MCLLSKQWRHWLSWNRHWRYSTRFKLPSKSQGIWIWPSADYEKACHSQPRWGNGLDRTNRHLRNKLPHRLRSAVSKLHPVATAIQRIVGSFKPAIRL